MFGNEAIHLPKSLVEVLEEEYEALGGTVPPGEDDWFLHDGDLIDAKSLVLRIHRAPSDDPRSIDRLLRRRLGPNALAELDGWAEGLAESLPENTLFDALNALIEHGAMPGATDQPKDESLWDSTAFEGVALSDWTCQLTGYRLDDAGRRQRNRLLLHEAYPQSIRSRLSRHYARIHGQAPRRAALVLSGGGIRSATFALGILQGLARQKVLANIDYLSTVSGGGYIGGWLSAWMHQHPRRLEGAVEALGEDPVGPLSPEPSPVHHLRSYSNYLTPRLGILSADTWSLLAIIARNMVLNWGVLLPLFVAVLAVPRVAVAAARWDVPAADAVNWLEWLGLAALLWSVAFVGWNLPAGRRAAPRGNEGRGRVTTSAGEDWVLRLCILPLAFSASVFTLSWAWTMRSGRAPDRSESFKAIVIAGIAIGVIGLTAYVLRLAWMFRGQLFKHLPGASPAGTSPMRALQRVGGFVLSQIFIGAGTVAGAAAIAWVLLPIRFRGAEPGELNLGLYTTVAPPVLLGLVVLAASFFAGMSSRWMEDDSREWLGRLSAWLLIFALGWLALCTLVIFGPDWLLHWHPIVKGAAAAFAAASGLFTVFAGRSGSTSGPGQAKRTDLKAMVLDHAVQIASLAFIVALVIALSLGTSMLLQALIADRLGRSDLQLGHARLLHDAFVHRRIIENLPIRFALYLTCIPAALGFILSHYIDVNKFSMHSTYRNRLMRAYLGASRPTRSPNWFTGFDDEDNVPMQELWPAAPDPGEPGTPPRNKLLHVINVTLNLVQGSNLAWQERKAESFTITALHCGSYHLGYRPAKEYGDRQGISLGTAMTISGAAASPNMGYHSSTLVSFVMCLFNARLGAWMANPGVRGQTKIHKTPTTWSVGPLVREALGMTTDRNRYVYLSDGGHFENLGLYEMVLRRCRHIVVSDASGDPDYDFADLGNAVRKIRIDLGVPIEFDQEIAIGRDGTSKFFGNYCAIGVIRYSVVDGKDANDGVLIYFKPAIIRGEPRDVLDYAAKSTTFPQESTLDQFFSESQFEAYRALGQHMIETIGATITGWGGLDSLEMQAREHVHGLHARTNGATPAPANPRVPWAVRS